VRKVRTFTKMCLCRSLRCLTNGSS
jgi:hypothetical protein